MLIQPGDFIRTIAYDFAGMLCQLEAKLGDQLSAMLQNLVLGGYGGAHFGLFEKDGRLNDVFVPDLTTAMKQHPLLGHKVYVQRTSLTPGDYRLLDAFHYAR